MNLVYEMANELKIYVISMLAHENLHTLADYTLSFYCYVKTNTRLLLESFLNARIEISAII